MHYILAAISSSLSYAIADIGNGILSKKNSAIKISLWATIFGTLIFFIPAIVYFQHELAKLTVENFLIITGQSLIVIIAYLAFITGMTKGSVTLTGVLGGSFPAITTLVSLLVFGDKVSMLQGLAIILVLTGVALSSMEGSLSSFIKDIRSSSIWYGITAMVMWGIYFAIVRIPIERVGWFLPQYLSNVLGIPVYILIAKYIGEKKVLALPKLPWLAIIISVLQVVGSMLYNYAASTGNIAVIAPITGSSPAFFVTFAYFVFREKIKPIQTAGIISAVVGIIFLSIVS